MDLQDSAPIIREEQLAKLRGTLREGQKRMGDWEGGEMAIAAVPGAGKSYSLAVAAALTVARYKLHPRRQLIVVTYTRSAAASIKGVIRDQLKSLSLIPGGYEVHTLHGLACSIATRHPELSQLNLATATLINPHNSHRLIKNCVQEWIAAAPEQYKILLEGAGFDGEETERLRREWVLRTEVLPTLATTAIAEAKSSALSPEDLQFVQIEDPYHILAMAGGLYKRYEALMAARNFIDYQDMILAALRVLEYAPIRKLWQSQVFAVFEDEAQDSSPLQERLIKLLATDPENPETSPNLVRVGDPNQAINSTFTPADPIYFNSFCTSCQGQGSLSTMAQAGRSSQIIMNAANFVLKWVNENTKEESLPFRDQEIHPVEPGDLQKDANPEPVGGGLEIYTPPDIYKTAQMIGERAVVLLKENSQHNAAILVRENRQGRFLAEQLAPLTKSIKIYEVNEVQRQTNIPAEVLKLLQFIHRPHSPNYLKAALEVLQNRQLIPTQDLNPLAAFPEKFLYPGSLEPKQKPQVAAARRYCCNLLQGRLELPHYQLIFFLGLTLKYTGSELATVEKLGERINQQIVGRSSLQSTIEVLVEIVNEERFEGVLEEEIEDEYTRPGQLTIITMHKAKGLDWDYVFIPFLHEDVLPGSLWVPTAAKFLGNFTLAEVARAQIRAKARDYHLNNEHNITMLNTGNAWKEAARLKRGEEFRLLYVAMTRAKRLLWMSAAQKGPFRWSIFKGDRHNLQKKEPCPVLPTLQRHFSL